ncbi:MAG TPA: hypothetical protein VG738_22530 [Chitinophagaceae bacterium]|nr:hypothetical protein [Chitinophagaceae bacterium]
MLILHLHKALSVSCYIMTKLSDENKIEFYKFLNGDISVSDLEKFIYKHSDLEQQLDKDIYLELISLDFKDKYVIATLPDFIKKNIIEEGQFETWKLRNVLNTFLTDPVAFPFL